MNQKIRLVLFDLDGVLIDSGLLVTQAFEHTFNAFQLPASDDERTRALSGSTLREVYEPLAAHADVEQMIRTHTSFQDTNLHLVAVHGGVIPTLQRLREKNVHTGIVTNRSFNARSIIRHCGMDELIGLVVSFEDVKNPKPHPEGILKAMQHFQVSSHETVMVGDMADDILAGEGANAVTVGVDTSDQLEALKASDPDYIVHSVSDLIPLFADWM